MFVRRIDEEYTGGSSVFFLYPSLDNSVERQNRAPGRSFVAIEVERAASFACPS